jgi:hypothetical protein
MVSDPSKDAMALTAFVAALTRAFDEGSSVVGQSTKHRHKLAAVALRRIKSFERRGVSINDRARCIRDLARGLADQFEANPSLVGPLIENYRMVANELLDAYGAVGGS